MALVMMAAVQMSDMIMARRDRGGNRAVRSVLLAAISVVLGLWVVNRGS